MSLFTESPLSKGFNEPVHLLIETLRLLEKWAVTAVLKNQVPRLGQVLL